MTPQQLTAYENSSEAIQGLFSSFEAAIFNKKLINKYQIAEADSDMFLESTGDAILNLITIESLPAKLASLESLSEEKAVELTNDLLNYIQEGTKGNKVGESADKSSGTPSLVSELSSSTPTSPSKEQKTPATPPSVRTMEQDIGKIHGYGAAASQGEEIATREEPVVKSLSQDELRGQNAAVPDYSKGE